MLYLIGLGLGGPRDITVRGLEVVRQCDKVFLEKYTAVFTGTSQEDLEEFYGRDLITAYREDVEGDDNAIVQAAIEGDAAMLVVGDPMCATTHSDMFLRVKELGGDVEIIHNASIMNAIACTGLSLYDFGMTISIPFWNELEQPTSFYDKIKVNMAAGYHTLCLLDIKVRELTIKALMYGRTEYMPPTYMTVNHALQQLLDIADLKGDDTINLDTIAVGVARVGYSDQIIRAGPIRNLLDFDFGAPLHSIVIVKDINDIERKMLECFGLPKQV